MSQIRENTVTNPLLKNVKRLVNKYSFTGEKI